MCASLSPILPGQGSRVCCEATHGDRTMPLKKHTLIPGSGTEPLEFVDWCDDPLHQYQWQNAYARVYTAAIQPGQSTLFHRHKEDTAYITIENSGARLLNEKVLPNKGGISPPVQTEFVEGDPFFMMHKEEPMVHRVSSPASNEGQVKFLAVEMLSRPPISEKWQLRDLAYDLVLKNSKARVYRYVVFPLRDVHAVL